MQKRLSLQAYIDGVLAQDRVVLSRAITLTESQLSSDAALAQQLLEALLPHTGRAVRLGITGVPGVGKSTFIEAFGLHLTDELGKKIAVLAIDPSSQVSKGSILGDKTRMEQLARHPRAYIRPSPTSGSLGGVAHKTRESMLLCEAAGFEVILVETVGVGQSETLVRGMVDFFLLLMLAGAGDELQGIKKGIMEMADGLAITKADGANEPLAKIAQVEYQNALHLFPMGDAGWVPQVLTCSALRQKGIGEIWLMVENYVAVTQKNGYFAKCRHHQQLAWMQDYIHQSLEQRFNENPSVQELRRVLEQKIIAGTALPMQAAEQLLNIFWANHQV